LITRGIKKNDETNPPKKKIMKVNTEKGEQEEKRKKGTVEEK
jgi:hypothetical protein